jgi:hypothetical protein
LLRKRKIGINRILVGSVMLELLQCVVYSLFNSSVKLDVGGICPFNESHSVLVNILAVSIFCIINGQCDLTSIFSILF